LYVKKKRKKKKITGSFGGSGKIFFAFEEIGKIFNSSSTTKQFSH